MTNPNTPREDEIGGLFATLGTEQQETLTAARGATDRQAAIIADMATQLEGMRANQVDEETLAEFRTNVESLKAAADDAQAAFDKVGVPETEPEEPTDEPPAPVQARRRK